MSNIDVRWMIRRDMPEVMEIEQLCFEFQWSEDDFIRCLRQRTCVGMVATKDAESENVVGFMIYELSKTTLHILNFAVHPSAWRRGFGRAMIDKLKSKLSKHRRTRITCEVRESNLGAQSFFKSQGMRATMIIKEHYEDTPEDAYFFAYRVPAAVPAESS